MKTVEWYFDFISPFAYLQFVYLQQRYAWRLPTEAQVRFKPVLLASLLQHWGSKGLAEIPAKRVFTYRQVLWLARQHGIALRMPPAHPFNPLKALRLAKAIARGIFGVPIGWVEGELFWGVDSTAMLLAYLNDPALFTDPEMQRISHLPVGVQRL